MLLLLFLLLLSLSVALILLLIYIYISIHILTCVYIYAIYIHMYIYIHVYAFYMHCMNIPPAKHIETIHQPLPPLLTRLPAAAMAERAPEAAPSDSCPVGDMFKGYIWKICCGLIGDLSKFVGCMICICVYICIYIYIYIVKAITACSHVLLSFQVGPIFTSVHPQPQGNEGSGPFAGGRACLSNSAISDA